MKARNQLTALALCLLIFATCGYSQTGNEEEQQFERDYAVIAQFERVFTHEIAHSNDDYGIYIGRIGIEKWYADWWSLRFELQPFFYASSDTRPSLNALGFAVTWCAYFDKIGQLEPFFGAELGYSYWEEKFPIDAALEHNFTIEFTYGFSYSLDEHNDILFGARYWHLSNNNWGFRNPGVNGFSFFGGYRYVL